MTTCDCNERHDRRRIVLTGGPGAGKTAVLELILRTPLDGGGYNRSNPLRVETAEQAAAIDARIARMWKGHPRRFVVEASADFLTKAARSLEILRNETPECCQHHIGPPLESELDEGH